MSEAVELEIKFRAPEGFEPDFTGVAAADGGAEFLLRATYLDAPDRTLTRSGWSLRRREGGHDDGWHLKRPVDAGGRLELQHPLSVELPDEIRAQVTSAFGPIALAPVATVTTRRREIVLSREGRPVALLAHDTVEAVSAAGSSAWSEWELELVDAADAALLDELGAAMLAQGAHLAPAGSKVGQALGVLPPARVLDRTSSAAQVLGAYTERQIGMLQAQAGGVRVDAPDAVHKARVATRRLRSLLRVYRDFYEPDVRDEVSAELRWLAGMLGEPRDAEVLAAEFGVLLAELGPEVVDADVRHRLLGHLAEVHAESHAALVEAWDGDRARALRDRLAGWLTAPPLLAAASEPAFDVLPAARQAAIDRVAKLRRRAERRQAGLEAWHEVRKAAKRVRYATEALAAARPALTEEAIQWEAVTEALGTVQDAVVCREVIESVRDAADADPEHEQVWRVLLDAQADRLAAGLVEGRQALSDALA